MNEKNPTYGNNSTSNIIPIWFFFTKNKTHGAYTGKRLLDVTLSLFLITLSAPIALLFALLILISSGKPIIFTQKRSIPGGKTFTIFKFRSMEFETQKITWIGKIMRPFHIDEIPQFWNVLRGEMSLVGPRPIPIETIRNSYKKISSRSIQITGMPGITGLAQITKTWPRNHSLKVSLDEEKISFYLFLNKAYEENCCFHNDICILFLTIFRCLLGKSN